MKTSELEYVLPPARIAQASAHPRDHSRLMVVDAARLAAGDDGASAIGHKKFFEITKFLRRGDVLVFNNSKVFRARLHGDVVGVQTRAEIFLVRPSDGAWHCLGKPGKKLCVGARVKFTRTVYGEVIARADDGTLTMKFFVHGRGRVNDRTKKLRVMSPAAVIQFANAHGEIPVPPYVAAAPKKFAAYQTVYARHAGSVAAPTAGFHFTRALLKKLSAAGIARAEVTLHVGLGTFQPIKTETVEAHTMHAEWTSVSAAAARTIMRAKSEGRRVIAVGTTSVRTLEAWARASEGAWNADVNLFITPGFEFKIVDALVTNFHLPKSTLMLLVAAFLESRGASDGLAALKKLYAEAIARDYRFYSFGDAMMLY